MSTQYLYKRWGSIQTVNHVTWKIGGQAGFGIMETGHIFAKCCLRSGLHVVTYTEYPSLIRGGHNTVQVRVEEKPFHAMIKPLNILIALNEETAVFHKDELTEGAVLIYDPADAKVDDGRLHRDDVLYVPIELSKIIHAEKAPEITRNVVAIGASMGMLNFDFVILESVIRESFADKGKEVEDLNVLLAKKGYDAVKDKSDAFPFRLEKRESFPRMLLTGNDALFLGSVRAGCKFMAAYPMTPSTSIVQSFAAIEEEYGIIVKEPEDEMGAINFAIGASLAGARAMTATSGGGFCLMTESVGLAAMTETPIVIVNSMRGGPSTGLPTWTDQGDLRFCVHASHGEFPRIVVAPGDVEESFYLAFDAFNLSDKYQMPVIIMSDKHLASSSISMPKFKEDHLVIDRGKLLDWGQLDNVTDYKRFQFVEDGISPRSVPGMKNGLFVATSDEHDETGLYDEEIDNRNKMMQKRFKKVDYLKNELPPPILHGPEDADVTIVSWGSPKMAILDAMEFMKNDVKVNFLQLQYIEPFPADVVATILGKAKKTLLVEATYTAQLAGIIRQHTGIALDDQLLKYSGRPFFPEEICDKVRSML